MSNLIYCTYITFYYGNKLPLYYIGYSSVDNILNRNYRGTVTSREYHEVWKEEIKQNPHLFKTKIIKKFETKAEAKKHECYLQLHLKVHKNPLYTNKTVNYEKFFSSSPPSEETRKKIGDSNRGKVRSAELREYWSKQRKGKKRSKEVMERKMKKMRENGYVVWNKGMKFEFSEEEKQKRYGHRKGVPIVAQKLGTEAVIGSIWINNGITNKRIKPDDIIPEGFVIGRLYKKKPKTPEGKKWYNDGNAEGTFFEGTEPEGWIRGRLKFSQEHINKMADSKRKKGK